MRVGVDAERVRERVVEWRRGVEGRRRRLVAGLMEAFRRRVSALTPVRTGRARRGWGSDAGGQSLGIASGEDGASLRELSTGVESAQRTDERGSQTAIEIENRVPYIEHLEYGTRRMRPRGMARRAMTELAARVRRGGAE